MWWNPFCGWSRPSWSLADNLCLSQTGVAWWVVSGWVAWYLYKPKYTVPTSASQHGSKMPVVSHDLWNSHQWLIPPHPQPTPNHSWVTHRIQIKWALLSRSVEVLLIDLNRKEDLVWKGALSIHSESEDPEVKSVCQWDCVCVWVCVWSLWVCYSVYLHADSVGFSCLSFVTTSSEECSQCLKKYYEFINMLWQWQSLLGSEARVVWEIWACVWLNCGRLTADLHVNTLNTTSNLSDAL